jgi:hypothetical protein
MRWFLILGSLAAAQPAFADPAATALEAGRLVPEVSVEQSQCKRPLNEILGDIR